MPRAAQRRIGRTARDLAVALLLAAALLAPEAGAQVGTPHVVEPQVELSVADERPLRGQAVRVTVADGPAPAAEHVVTAIYRPNSSTGHTEIVGSSDASGTLFWTPSDAGPVILEARAPGADPKAAAAASLRVAVRFGGFPPRGLGIMVLAGLLLFGGAIVGFVMLLGPRAHAPTTTESPST
ncbi:MAG TPA: hypothetical protein VHQ65_12345 [Thermoanaerobaculia bacterium]|nr:hypothetical protein [Thermoanaerobaculia bacterium]